MSDLDDIYNRVGRLEEDVSELKVDTAKIAAALEAQKEIATSRHAAVVKSLEQLKAAANCEQEDRAAVSRWLREVLTPQTIAIILAILAAAVGAPMMSQQVMGLAVSPTTPVTAIAIATESEEEPEEATTEEAPKAEVEEATPE